MRVVCSPDPRPLDPEEGIAYSLFSSPGQPGVGRIATAMPLALRRCGFHPPVNAWDFLAISLSAAAADQACLRSDSPDGWTREIDLRVAVNDPGLWNRLSPDIEAALRFLTGDVWRLSLEAGGAPRPKPTSRSKRPPAGDSVCLLSGGVDSLVGAIDVVADGARPILVSQVAQGDADRQRRFAREVGDQLGHLQLTHAIRPPGIAERSQRARSIVFLAYGVLAASSLACRGESTAVDLVVPENGFISLNIPLTPLRLGTLSTRTTHPHFLGQIQAILDAAGLEVRLSNPYQFHTKGEMLHGCRDQALLASLVQDSTSCGRFARYGYTHCGRCVPCLARRAAFHRWGASDLTHYKFADLSINDSEHRHFDDVRSVSFAWSRVAQGGVGHWAGSALSHVLLGDTEAYAGVAGRGIEELHDFLSSAGAL